MAHGRITIHTPPFHRIASSGEIKGIFNTAMEYALQHYDTIRIDTHRDNKVMQKAIVKFGFEYCGIIHCWRSASRQGDASLEGQKNDDERLAYQR